MYDLDNLKEAYNRLSEILDCKDNSCQFKKKNEHGVYGMRTNGGCRCFKDINPYEKAVAIERLVRVVGKMVNEKR